MTQYGDLLEIVRKKLLYFISLYIFLLVSIQNSEARMSFDMKRKTLNETIHNVDLQLFKDQLSEDALKTLSTSTCKLEHGITLILKTIHSKGSVSFVTNISLSKKDLMKKQWIGFHGLKTWYIQTLEKSHANITTATLKLSTLPECAGISLGDLGIKSHPGYEPLMVVYSDASEIESEENLNNLLNKLQLVAKRSAQLETNSSSGVEPDPTIRCQLISYNVRYIHIFIIFKYILSIQISFGEFNIGLLPPDNILEFNYCSGHCVLPIPDHQSVNHSKIAAALISRPTVTDKPKAPCCVPVKYSSIYLPVFVPDGAKGTYKLEPYSNMTALKCGCR